MKKLPDSFNGRFSVENRFDFRNLNECTFKWELINFRLPGESEPGYITLNEGSLAGADIQPHETGTLELNLPEDQKNADALILKAFDPFNQMIDTWTWKIRNNTSLIQKWLPAEPDDEPVGVRENDSLIILTAKKISVVFNKQNGLLSNIRRGRNRLNFNNGPVLCAGEASFDGIKHFKEDNGYVVEMKYNGNLKVTRWKMLNNGWLELTYEYHLKRQTNFMGISFDFPEEYVLSAKWLGLGPYRVWKNRMEGVHYNVWEKAYNNTITGTYPWLYPEFKGYYSDVTWMEFNTVEGKFLVASQNDDLFIRLFEFYSLPGLEPHPELPAGDISFLDGIPPTGSKMSTRINARPSTLGPNSMPNNVDSTFKRTLLFYFGVFKK